MASRYRASKSTNAFAQADLGPCVWGVVDSHKGEFVSKCEYVEAFAKILASAMNRAYVAGVSDGKREG